MVGSAASDSGSGEGCRRRRRREREGVGEWSEGRLVIGWLVNKGVYLVDTWSVVDRC